MIHMVGARIKEFCTNKNLTINELVPLSRVSKSYISSIERGLQKKPSFKVLKKLAETLHLLLESNISIEKTEIVLDDEWIEPLKIAIHVGLTKRKIHEFVLFVHYKKMRRVDE
jgi:XRE family transcriptional regulator, master regulator for biofilm formation